MATNVFWDTELDDVLIVRFIGRWTWEDYRKSIDIGLQLINGRDGRLDIITDMTDAYGIPDGVGTPSIMRGRREFLPRFTMQFVVQINNYIDALANALNQADNTYVPSADVHQVATLAEARDRIRQDRNAINGAE